MPALFHFVVRIATIFFTLNYISAQVCAVYTSRHNSGEFLVEAQITQYSITEVQLVLLS